MNVGVWATVAIGFGICATLMGCPIVGSVGDGGGGGDGGAGAEGGGRASVGRAPAAGLCLPPEIQAIANKCDACHSNPPKKSAPMPLVTLDDFRAPSPRGVSIAERCVARMKAVNSMPPTGPLPADEIAAFSAW